MNFIDSWKNLEIFQDQLELNLKEISHEYNYPEHWHEFLKLVQRNSPKTVLDIGCGSGVYCKLCELHFPNIKYTGIDYSEEAIKLAKETWKYDDFFTMNYKDLTREYIKNFDLLHMGALLDILPNGDEALEYILSLDPKSVLISRIRFTNNDSYSCTGIAYNKITTYEFHHNKREFLDLFIEYNYHVYKNGNSFYLKKEFSL